MAKVRNILNHVAVETASRRRKCHRKAREHVIQGGERCLVVKERDGLGSKNYCQECASAIFAAAREHLGNVEHEREHVF